MIIQYNGQSYEESRSLNQNLTFQSLEKALYDRNIDFGPSQMRTLHLLGEDDLFTNLALLLSDQCPFTTKTAIFQGNENIVFRDRQEFQGSIIKQMDEVYKHIDLANKTKATFSGLNRIDTRDYPEEALREVWLNCIVHRDYSFSGSTIINIYENRIEFVSLGGLVPGLDINSIFLGVSQSRNPHLAALFYRMRLIESYGTGISKIQRSYKLFNKEPIFESAKGVFRVTLPNLNEGNTINLQPKKEKKVSSIIEDKKKILDFVSQNGSITRIETENILHSKPTKASRLLKELCDENRLKMEGGGKKTRYFLN